MSNVKKIGFVLNAPIKYSETFLRKEFLLMESLGYKVILFEGYGKSEEKIPFETVKSLPNTYCGMKSVGHIVATLLPIFTFRLGRTLRFVLSEIKSGAELSRALKRVWFNAHILNNKVDYLHFCFADVAIQKELVAKVIGAKMSVSLRGSDILIYPINNKECYKRLWRYTDKVHSVSNWVYTTALNLNLSSKKLNQIIYDFVNTESIRFNYSNLRSPIEVLTVGRLEPVKDHEFALKVIDYLVKRGLNLKFTIVGEGSLKKNLYNLIEKLNLTGTVKLIGKLSHPEVKELMSNSDLYIHTSRSEGLNVSLLEAQASGLLTISLNTGATDENIEDTKSGWVVQERIVAKMGEKIIEVLNLTNEERLKVKSYARSRIRDNFDIERRRNEWKDFFEF